MAGTGLAAPEPAPGAAFEPEPAAEPETACAEAPAGPVPDRGLRRVLRITAIANGVATLEAPRAPACGTCAARTGCGAAALARLSAPIMAQVPAAPGMRPGDAVAVTFPAETFLAAMALAYLLPPAALALAVGLFAALGLPDLLSAALCAPVFLLSLLPLRRAERRGRLAGALRADPADGGAEPEG